jgi:hypothetical protein
VIDGIADGYPNDAAAEWSSAGQGAGAWVQLTWAQAVSLGRVVLFDQPTPTTRLPA